MTATARTAGDQHADTRDMVVIHRLFRREFRRLPDFVLAAPRADAEGLARITNHTRELVAGLRHHHEIEDELLWPKLRDRATFAREVVERMAAQHAELGPALERCAGLAEQLPGTADQLASVIRGILGVLEAHLDEEEREILPQVRSCITASEWAELGDRGLDSIPPRRRLTALGLILEGASASERALFLRRAPFPARVLFRLVGERRARREKAALERVLSYGNPRTAGWSGWS